VYVPGNLQLANTMTPYRTRPATAEDEPFLYDCYRRTMHDYVERTWSWNEDFQRLSFAEHLPWRRFQIISVGSAAIGGACVVCAPDGVELEMLVIDPRFQRQGIGSDFVATLMRRAHEHGRSVSLRVLKVNPAKALYDRLGFIVVGEDAATYEMRSRP
jgi:ribosomal protein S18 acetylase RimI-like enzyme